MNNLWKKYNKKEIFDYALDYKKFISNCKTERECVKEVVKEAKKRGFVQLKEKQELKWGDKIYITNKEKAVVLFVIGKDLLEKGINIIGSHIDSPRLDLKPNPLFEKDNFTYLDTHYYGGIKKYQWLTIPLAIHGIIIKKDGTKLELNIGEDESDPVVGITDLLPHLAKEQMKKKAEDFVDPENLDIIVSSIDKTKQYLLNLLREKYNIEEEDFISSEIEIVPSFKAKDFGLDRSMILGYGHDDRSCAYSAFKALLDIENPDRTCACLLVDKEEIGSCGATGMKSTFFSNAIMELLNL